MVFKQLAAILAVLATAVPAAAAPPSRAAEILERFTHANRWRDHVMVVAHRGGWMEHGEIVAAENSRAAAERAIALGAEVIEVDVRRAADGTFVVMHDSWLDRTTTCRGEVDKRTLAELKRCRLVIEGRGVVTPEVVPTLGEFLAAVRGRALVNLDNKLEPADLVGMVAVARGLGMAGQVIIKENLWNAGKVAEMQALLPALADAHFMPIIADDAVHDVGFLEAASGAVHADAVEMINWRRDGDAMTADGGVLFSPRARAVAARGDFHLWVDTYSILHKDGGYLAGGRGDKLAVLADVPDQTYGFWVDRGATIIQTDEPRAAIDWLTSHGYRVPYRPSPEQARLAADMN
jgi:glycerophosphoryl diester phosphodiesterase